MGRCKPDSVKRLRDPGQAWTISSRALVSSFSRGVELAIRRLVRGVHRETGGPGRRRVGWPHGYPLRPAAPSLTKGPE